MRDIDRQSEEIKKIWEQYDEEEAKQFAPEIIETPAEVDGLMDMEIKNPVKWEDLP